MTRSTYARRLCRLFVLGCFACLMIGCSAGQGISAGRWSTGNDVALHIRSRANPDADLVAGFNAGIYSQHDPSSITVLLVDGPIENPSRALIIRMFWKPKASVTPLDETATNATVQYIVFNSTPDTPDAPDTPDTSDRAHAPQVGVYSGGGFLFPESDLGVKTLQANLWQATLSLADASEGFEDTLGPSIMKGRFTARRDDEAIIDALRRVNIAVSERLGVPRFVRAD